MRVYVITSPNEENVSFNYQPKLVGILHRWIGANDLHGNLSVDLIKNYYKLDRQ